MAKLNNKGFSLIELIIAIAVFTFMIVPIISQLMVSMRISDRSRALQEDSEYAEYIMEYFKSTPLDQIGQDNLFDGCNALQVKEAETIKTENVGGATIEYSSMSFEIPKANAVTIGKGKYYSEITLDTKYYALEGSGYRSATSDEMNILNTMTDIDGNLYDKDGYNPTYTDGDGNTYDRYESDEDGDGTNDTFGVTDIHGNVYIKTGGTWYVRTVAQTDPNKVNVGNLTNLDSSVVAIIDGDTSNCDKTASDAIFTMKSDLLKADDLEKWEQLMYGGYSDFGLDTVTKVTRISVEQGVVSGETSYTVKAVVEYQDNNGTYSTTLPAYNVYQKVFVQDEPPVIYFMYNPCVYNAEYMVDDYVVLDTSAAGGAEIKLYMIETAAEIPAEIQQIMTDNGISFDSSDLIEYVDTSGTRVKRDEVVTHFNVATGSDTSKIKVFTNKSLSRINDYDLFANLNISETYAGNVAPGTISGTNVAHFVKSLTDDVNYEGRLYTITVTLYDASDDSVVATYTGTRGAN